jgi:hypothetical protein
MENTNLIVAESTNLLVTEAQKSYYSMKPSTDKEKIALFNAINKPNHRIKDFVNKPILVKDVLLEMVTLKQTDGDDKDMVVIDDEGNPIEKEMPRIILIDVNGESYQCVSVGVFSAVKRIIQFFGEPTWDKGIKIIPTTVSVGNKGWSALTLELA